MANHGVLVECVACSAADAISARDCGAARIELCSAIELGGLTPTSGTVVSVSTVTDLPVMAMVRPRGGDFVYSESELQAMEDDIPFLRQAGASGIVFGALNPDDTVCVEACGRLISKAAGLETVFHRAFDRSPNPEQALEILIGLGFTRVLTAGGPGTALEGVDTLRKLLKRAGNRIEILAGGRIRGDNVQAVRAASGIDQFHLGPMKRIGQGSGPYGEGHLVLDSGALREVIITVALEPHFGR